MKNEEILDWLVYYNRRSEELDNDLASLVSILSGSVGLGSNSTFEYCISKKDNKIKVLSLLFYGDLENQEKIFKGRKEQIKEIFNKLIERGFNIDIKKLNLILGLINNINFPLQIAFDYNKGISKVKLYISNIKRFEKGNTNSINKLLKKILNIMGLEDSINKGSLLGEGIDCIGVDFNFDGRTSLKVYTYFNKKYTLNKTIKFILKQFEGDKDLLSKFLEFTFKKEYSDFGFLYRIEKQGIKSKKFWYRLKESFPSNELKTLLNYNLMDLFNKLQDISVSYLTCDGNNIEVYFRSKNIIKNQDYFFKLLTEKIAATDFTGYTIQYPPMFLWKKNVKRGQIKGWGCLESDDKLGVYIHIPFCNQKCNFCRYFSQEKTNAKELDKYLKYLEKEIELYHKHLAGKKIHSLYIGGGTPSILSPEQLTKLFDMINSNFDFVDDIQKCMEVNPHSTNYEKLKVMKKAGINRLTIGVQTLTQKVLRKVNREQTEKEAIDSIKLAKELGFENINIDLMSGLPRETIASFKKTVERIVLLKPDMMHIHPFYPTPYTEFMKKGNRLSKQQMDIRSNLSEIGGKILKKEKYKGIKFDALGLKDSARNIQLSDAIEHVSSYIGFGPGAVSHIKGKLRYVNFDDINKYFSRIDKNILPIMKISNISEKDEMIYYITSCLRYGSLSKKDFYKHFNQNILEVFGKQIRYLKKRKVISEDSENFNLIVDNIGEYLIYSKYFYEDSVINDAKNAIGYQNKQLVLSKEEIKYMCL